MFTSGCLCTLLSSSMSTRDLSVRYIAGPVQMQGSISAGMRRSTACDGCRGDCQGCSATEYFICMRVNCWLVSSSMLARGGLQFKVRSGEFLVMLFLANQIGLVQRRATRSGVPHQPRACKQTSSPPLDVSVGLLPPRKSLANSLS
jgi:hypothetical protein